MALNPVGPHVTLRWICPLEQRATDTPTSQTAPGNSHCAGQGHGLCVNTQPHHTAKSKVVLAPSGEHRPQAPLALLPTARDPRPVSHTGPGKWRLCWRMTQTQETKLPPGTQLPPPSTQNKNALPLLPQLFSQKETAGGKKEEASQEPQGGTRAFLRALPEAGPWGPHRHLHPRRDLHTNSSPSSWPGTQGPSSMTPAP